MALTTVGNGDKAPSTHVGKVEHFLLIFRLSQIRPRWQSCGDKHFQPILLYKLTIALKRGIFASVRLFVTCYPHFHMWVTKSDSFFHCIALCTGNYDLKVPVGLFSMVTLFSLCQAPLWLCLWLQPPLYNNCCLSALCNLLRLGVGSHKFLEFGHF